MRRTVLETLARRGGDVGPHKDGWGVAYFEGKVNESFGEPASKWGPESSPGKQKRFQYLTR